MGPAGFPVVGAQVRRKSDGILGEVYLTDSSRNLLSVRWATVPGAYGREDFTPEQFARVWTLTGVMVAPPHETKVALTLITALVVLLFVGVIIHNSHGYNGYEPYMPLSVDTSTILNNAKALDGRYGVQASQTCAAGADDYIRSVAGHRFHWNDSEMLSPRFDRFVPAVSAPGILTMISGKAAVSNGFGVFSPITLYCNYDTQSHEVLSYAVEGLPQ